MPVRWTPLGPTAILPHDAKAGAVTSILAESGGMLVGTPGGVWRLDGTGWHALTDRLGAFPIGALARDPAAHGRIYAATGIPDRGGHRYDTHGVLVTEDGGTTWDRFLLPAPAGPPLALVTVEAGVAFHVSEAAVHLTVDGGVNWTVFDTPGGDSATVARDPDSGVTRVLLTRADRLYSLEHGLPFTASHRFQFGLIQQDPLVTISLATAPGNPAVVYAFATDMAITTGLNRMIPRGLFRSLDAGNTWTQLMDIPRDYSPEDPLTRVFAGDFHVGRRAVPLAVAGDDEDLLAVALNRTWRIAVGSGLQLLEAGIGSDHPPGLPPDSRASANVVADVDGTIWIGASGGLWEWAAADDTIHESHWARHDVGRTTTEMLQGAQDAHLDGLLLASNGIAGGPPLESQAHPLWGQVSDEPVRQVAIREAGTGWIVNSLGSLDVARAVPAVPPSNARFRSLRHLGLDFRFATSADGRVTYAGLTDLQRFEDGAPHSFPEFDLANAAKETIRALAVSPLSNDRLWVALDSAVVRGDVSTVLFQKFPLPPRALPLVPVSAIAVSPHFDDRVYVAFAESTFDPDRPGPTARILRKRGLLDDWEDLTAGLPDSMPIRAIAIDPEPPDADLASERIFVAGDQGVFESHGGTGWHRITDGLPSVPVMDLLLDPASRVLRAFTLGRGAWEWSLGFASDVDLYLRAHPIDSGRRPLPAIAPRDPFSSSGLLEWSGGESMRVDAAETDGGDRDARFQTPTTDVRFLDFSRLRRTQRARARDVGRVFLEIHDRGPDPAANVLARVYWTHLAGPAWPPLWSGFWSAFPADPPPGPWKPIGPAKTIAAILPAMPSIAGWEWEVPMEAAGEIGLLAIVDCPGDRALDADPSAMPVDVEALVRANKHVSARRVKVRKALPRASDKWKLVGEIAIAVVVAVSLVSLAEGKPLWEELE